MARVTYVGHDGTSETVDVPSGENVMRGAILNDIAGIVGECGGGLACATCHCYVDPAWLDRLEPPSDTEVELLESASSPVEPNSRLSCQILVGPALDGLTVRLPETQY